MIEFKIGAFRPEYAGKMNFYLYLLNNTVRKANEQPSIGITICQSKNRTVVEFAFRDVNKPVGVAIYTFSDTLLSEPRPPLSFQRRTSPSIRCRDGRLAGSPG